MLRKLHTTPISLGSLYLINYGHQKLIIRNFLTTHNLFGYVDGSIPCPSSTISSPHGTSSGKDYATAATIVTQSNPDHLNWLCKDAHVRMLILSTLSEQSFQHVQGTTSHELWLGLERAYAPHTSSREFTLKTQLLKIQMKGDETFAAYLARAQEYAKALAIIGQPMPEKDLVMLVVCCWFEEYNGVKQSLFARQFTAVFSKLPGLLANLEFLIHKSTVDISPVQAFTTATTVSPSMVQNDTVVHPKPMHPKPSIQIGLNSLLTAAEEVHVADVVTVGKINTTAIMGPLIFEIQVSLVGLLIKTLFMELATCVELDIYHLNARTVNRPPFEQDNRLPIMPTIAHKRLLHGFQTRAPMNIQHRICRVLTLLSLTTMMIIYVLVMDKSTHITLLTSPSDDGLYSITLPDVVQNISIYRGEFVNISY